MPLKVRLVVLVGFKADLLEFPEDVDFNLAFLEILRPFADLSSVYDHILTHIRTLFPQNIQVSKYLLAVDRDTERYIQHLVEITKFPHLNTLPVIEALDQERTMNSSRPNVAKLIHEIMKHISKSVVLVEACDILLKYLDTDRDEFVKNCMSRGIVTPALWEIYLHSAEVDTVLILDLISKREDLDTNAAFEILQTRLGESYLETLQSFIDKRTTLPRSFLLSFLQSAEFDKKRDMFEVLVRRYPESKDAWDAYVDFETGNGDLRFIETLLHRQKKALM